MSSIQIHVPHFSDDPTVQAEYEAAYVEGYQESYAAALSEGKLIGAAETRERIGAILASPEARGRETSASHFAFQTDMTADAAIGALATVPRSSAIGERQAGTVISFPSPAQTL